MKNYTIRTISGEFIFRGKYLRELETNHWHYYEREDGTLLHFRKEHMIWVIGDTAQSVLENKPPHNH